MCAYWHRPGGSGPSKVMSLVNLVSLPLSWATANGLPAQLEAVMHKRFILLLGMFLGMRVPTAAQTPAPQIVPTQDRIARIVTVVPTVRVPLLAAPFLLPDNPGKPAAHSIYLFAGAYGGHPGLDDLKSLSPMHEVKTLILTQSLLPLLQLWGGRLRLDGFASTLHMQSVQFGPSGAGGLRLPQQNYAAGPRSMDLYGVSLSFHLGRDAQVGHPTQAWRSLSRIVATVLN
jgi:hypothetical protein